MLLLPYALETHFSQIYNDIGENVSEINRHFEYVIEVQKASTNIADLSSRVNHTQLQSDRSIASTTAYR